MSDLHDPADPGGVHPGAIRFRVVLQELGEALAFGKGDHCLDLTAGAVVPASGCPDEQTGEARPALRRGKRFYRRGERPLLPPPSASRRPTRAGASRTAERLLTEFAPPQPPGG
jgi:hypothetical protein